jgi:hypothetical protein
MNKIFWISLFVMLPALTFASAQGNKDNYSSSSVLTTGIWIKLGVTSDGIYRIDYSKLKQLGLTNPSYPRIFSNNQGQLSYYNNGSADDDLREIPIYTNNGADGVFNDGDYLLFYAKGSGKWNYNKTDKDFDYLKHNYSDTSFYFLTSGTSPGKRIITTESPSQSATYYSNSSDILFHHELDLINLLHSGRQWYQSVTGTGLSINPEFRDILINEGIKYKIKVAARAELVTSFRLYEGNSVKKTIQVQSVNMQDFTGTYAQMTLSEGILQTTSTTPSFKVDFSYSGTSMAEGYLDYITLQARKTNTFTGIYTEFRDSRSKSVGRLTSFSIQTTQDPILWDISDIYNTTQIQYSKFNDSIVFKSPSDSLKTFAAFLTNNAKSPIFRQNAIQNQNLHGTGNVDMIIVAHPLFRNFAEKLSQIHNNEDGLISLIVTPEQIYNEFSGGMQDISAIRNFVRMKYLRQKGTSHPLKYLLLFGDGSYENKTLPKDNPNFVPTYQSENSTVKVSSFTSDDFYGLLDDGEGEADGTEDVGIGRIPVSDTTQAGIILRKISNYMNPINMGDWKNVVTLVADDEDGNIHMSDAEGLAALLKDSVPSINVDKIYLDAYKQSSSVNGQTYPGVNKAITDRINEGCLIFNYTGHGNENALAEENVINSESVSGWKNSGRLPLFITATCEFSRFDDIEVDRTSGRKYNKNSCGENVLLNPAGGGIALMSTTRVVYSAPNYFLNKNILDAAFDRDENGNSMSLGDIIRIAKLKSGSGYNKRNFTLLGDPALKLGFPRHGTVVTDSVNNVSISDKIDSLKALTVITVSGHVSDNNGKLMSDFNGIVSPVVYDKASKIRTLANDGGPTMEFYVRNSIVFSGKTLAKNGRFSFKFIVPRDIDYAYGQGKISYYSNDDNKDMSGNFSSFIIGGFSNSTISDVKGPNIRIFMNDTLFRNGGITDANPKLLVLVEDTGGINTTGSGIGHDLTGYLDNDKNNLYSFNSYYENDLGNYSKGKIIYNFSGISEGTHTLSIKAWDNFNNSTEQSIGFIVKTERKFVLNNLINYPNPFSDQTTFRAEHNRPDAALTIEINIFNTNGKIIKSIKIKTPAAGFVLPPITWDGTNDTGARTGRGIYLYSIIVTTEKGETVRSSGRLIIL